MKNKLMRGFKTLRKTGDDCRVITDIKDVATAIGDMDISIDNIANTLNHNTMAAIGVMGRLSESTVLLACGLGVSAGVMYLMHRRISRLEAAAEPVMSETTEDSTEN